MIAKAYDELVKSNETLIDKFKVYLDASNYDGKKDFKKWLGELVTATKSLESALSDTNSKLSVMRKALDEYVKQHKADIAKDSALTEAVSKIIRVMDAVQTNVESIQTHLNRNKA